MGVRTRTRAEIRKEAKKEVAFAKLNNYPSSPRKMRLIVDLIRGKRVEQALHILKHNAKQPSENLRKLLLSAIANWQKKNEGLRLEDSDLYVKSVFVDGGRQLKRLQTAPQGRAHRIRKRSNHVTLILGSLVDSQEEVTADEESQETENK